MRRCGKGGDQILDTTLRSQEWVERLRCLMDSWTRSCSWHLEGWNGSCGAVSSAAPNKLDIESKVRLVQSSNRWGVKRPGLSQRADQATIYDIFLLRRTIHSTVRSSC